MKKHLNDIYNMSIMISKTCMQHLQYDMADMFTIVCPIVPGGRTLENTNSNGSQTLKTYDLYTQYDKLTEEQVGLSCEWYNKLTGLYPF